ncbi:MAG: Rieske (2Fe-2S) protein [Myxococcales bacterium]|nr:Rieske (2Fe-2S) protein [Myxococcales bacterium]
MRLLDRSELRAGDVLEVFADERALVLADVGGVVHAVDSLCPHAGGPLGDGQLEGPTLTCPWHGWAFDVRSGSCEVSDDVRLRTFPVRIDAGAVWVDIGREG